MKVIRAASAAIQSGIAAIANARSVSAVQSPSPSLIVFCTKSQVEGLFPVFSEPKQIDGQLEWIVPDWLSVLWLNSKD